MAQALALEHLRVIDLTGHVAGPYCTKLLADFGANVVKVEKPGDGDGARNMGPFLGDIAGKERSGLFWFLNTNKRSVTLDLGNEKDRQILRKLVSHSDVLIESFPPGVMESWGLTYADLSQDNPSLVMTSISDFGQAGPYRDYKSTDIVNYALSGWMSSFGWRDREPLKHGLHQSAFRVGQYAAAATLAGVFEAQATEKGKHIDVSALECMVTGLVIQLCQYTYQGHIPGRLPRTTSTLGGRLAGRAQPVETKDGYVLAGVGGSGQSSWQGFADMMGDPALADPKFATPAGRDMNSADLDEILRRDFKEWKTNELVRTAQERRHHFTFVQSIKDFVNCPHLRERGYFVDVDQPETDRVKMPGAPFKMTRTPFSIRRRAPKLGEHNEGILSELPGEGPSELAKPVSHRRNPASRLPLEGVRILEPAAAYTVPHAGKLLAWFGAEVIKVESLVRPCNLRGVGTGRPPDSEPTREYWNESPSHNEVNLGKKSITLDFRTEEGREAFKDLVKISDVVMENFTPRVMEGFDLGYDQLVKVKPDLVMVSVSAFGHTGPYRNYGSFGSGMEVATGCAWVTGYRDGPPFPCYQAYPDDLTAMHVLFATLAALQNRNQTGKGQWIDLSMYEAGHFLAEAVMDYVLNGREGERLGSRDRYYVPQGCYKCLGNDQWVALSVGNHEQWVSLCNLIGKGELATHANFQTREQRWERHDEIDRYVQKWTQSRDKVQAMHELQKAGIPAGAVFNYKEVLLNRHLRSRDFYMELTHKSPYLGQKVYAGLPFTFNGTRLPNPRATPELGEHNWPVLTELLGVSPDMVQDWEKRDITGNVPLQARGASPRVVIPPEMLVERGLLQNYDKDYAAILKRGALVG